MEHVPNDPKRIALYICGGCAETQYNTEPPEGWRFSTTTTSWYCTECVKAAGAFWSYVQEVIDQHQNSVADDEMTGVKDLPVPKDWS